MTQFFEEHVGRVNKRAYANHKKLAGKLALETEKLEHVVADRDRRKQEVGEPDYATNQLDALAVWQATDVEAANARYENQLEDARVFAARYGDVLVDQALQDADGKHIDLGPPKA